MGASGRSARRLLSSTRTTRVIYDYANRNPGLTIGEYQFRELGAVDLSEAVDRFMQGIGSNASDALRRIIDAGGQVFSHTLLDVPGKPGAYATTYGAIT